MKSNKKWWGISGFLVVAIVLTIGILASTINYTKADKNTINLVASPKKDAENFIEADAAERELSAVLESSESAMTAEEIASVAVQSAPPQVPLTAAAETAVAKPGMMVEDENGIVWQYSETPIEIFHKEYGGEYPVTVLTSNGDKLIAPGTGDVYTFSVKNTGNVKLTYKVWTESYIDPEGLKIPIVVKMKDAKGGYMTGSSDEWAEFLSLNGAEDTGELAASSYANYALEWEWPYERGGLVSKGLTDIYEGDEYDTWLGNRAVDEALSVKIIIHVMACYDDNFTTGDTTNAVPYIAAIAGFATMMIVMIIILAAKKKKKEEQDVA